MIGAMEPAEAARSIAPRAAELAPEAESGRRLPAELVSSISDAGLFRMLVPADVGGGEAEPAQLVDAIFELARGDGSAGWCLAVAATSGMLGAYVARDAAQEIFGDEARVFGGVFAPMGRAVAGQRERRCLHGLGPLALRQRLPALRLADGRLPGRRRRRAAEARVRHPRHPLHALPRLGGRGDRHLERRRPARDRQPRLRGRRSDGARGALGLADHRLARAATGPSTPSRSSACWRSRSPRSGSASPGPRSTTWSSSRPRRSRRDRPARSPSAPTPSQRSPRPRPRCARLAL